MCQTLETGGAQFLFGVTEQFAKRFVDLEPTAVNGNNGHADRRVVERALAWSSRGRASRNRKGNRIRGERRLRVGRARLLVLNALGRAATLHAFLFVHRLIGLFEQLFEAGHALRLQRGNADTESELVRARLAVVESLEI